jgi:hypothetical protein
MDSESRVSPNMCIPIIYVTPDNISFNTINLFMYYFIFHKLRGGPHSYLLSFISPISGLYRGWNDLLIDSTVMKF